MGRLRGTKEGRVFSPFHPSIPRADFTNTGLVHSATLVQTVDRTDLFEGSLIRAMRRLDELLAQLESAAQVVGDARLAASFKAASAAIRRDIVFAASLYV